MRQFEVRRFSRRLQGDLPGDLHLLGNHQRGVGLSTLVKDAAELADSHAS